MKVSDPITMSRFLVTRFVDLRRRNTGMDLFHVVARVSWSEKRGARELSIVERWREVAPNIFQVTSQKK